MIALVRVGSGHPGYRLVQRVPRRVPYADPKYYTLQHAAALLLGRFCLLFIIAADTNAQLSTSAYRVLGQPDLHQQGINTVQATSLNGPGGVALDSRGGKVRLYVADTGNSRVLAWPDVHAYGIGDPPALVLGQPGPAYSNPQGIGNQGFNSPVGVAVNPTTGDLYVADTFNNRVLRFRDPFANPKVQPDAVYGQPDFNTLIANATGVSASSMSKPRAVACDAAGNLWVADTGNNRILRFGANSLNSTPPPPADTVIGQKDFASYLPDAGGTVSASGLDTPSGLAFDGQANLYVADSNNQRVLEFPMPLGPNNQNPAATVVFGAANLTSRGVVSPVSNTSIALPAGLDVDSSGKVYVASPAFNRVLLFPAGGGAATAVLGQSDFVTTKPDAGALPQASTNTLSFPFGLRVDTDGTVYVADVGNNRVLSFPPASKSAVLVWGQTDFSSNGVDQVKAAGMNSPAKVVIDYTRTPFALYVADTANNRVLVWKDGVNFHNGDPADMVIGQPNLYSGLPNVDTPGGQTPTSTSLAAPRGLAVDVFGNLWVADSGNNRVLHYSRPVAQSGRIAADTVLGQPDFTSSNSAVVGPASLNLPVGLALGPNGDLFVADAGNNRVLEFPAGPATHAAAIRVYGQASFTAGAAPATPSAQTLNVPAGIFVDAAANLYIADSGANRVVIIPNTLVAGSTATPAQYVIGQDSFNTATGGTGTQLRLPSDVTADSSGNIYISDHDYNRIVILPSLLFLPASGGVAKTVIGQQNLGGSAVNWNSTDGRATPEGLYHPFSVFMDRRDTLYVSDAGNNRVVHFLKPAAVLNVADYLQGAPVAQGGLAALFGSGLADTNSDPQSSPPWPTEILNRSIFVNDTIASALYQVSPGQINFQIPSGSDIGSNSISVRLADTGELLAGGTVLVAANSPGFFTLSQDGKGQAAARNQDGITVNGPANPAPRGSIISLYGTGQGQVSPAVPDGAGAPSTPAATTVAVPTSDAKTCLTVQPSVCVAIGASFGDIQFSGLAPNYVGLWQLNVRIPTDSLTGNAVPVKVVINGTSSNLFTIAIK
jgi:uncharacterized protein (TIGR03437 family)